MERQVGDVDTIDEQRPCGHLHHAAQGPGEGGLAGSHGPHHGHQLAGMQAEAHITERLALGAVVANGEATGFDATAPCHRSRQRLIRGDHAGRP